MSNIVSRQTRLYPRSLTDLRRNWLIRKVPFPFYFGSHLGNFHGRGSEGDGQ